jgi:hypothetical protein
MTPKIVILSNARAEEITGTITGSVIGVIAHRTFADILITLIIALCTGFLGGFGAHLFKLVKAKLSSRQRYNTK